MSTYAVVGAFVDARTGRTIKPGDPMPAGMTDERIRKLKRAGCIVGGPAKRGKTQNNEPAGGSGGLFPEGGSPPGSEGASPPGSEGGSPPGSEGASPPGSEGGSPPGSEGASPPGTEGDTGTEGEGDTGAGAPPVAGGDGSNPRRRTQPSASGRKSRTRKGKGDSGQ